MANVAIYYSSNYGENMEQAVLRINNLLTQLESTNVVLGVFIDTFNQSSELMELLSSPLSEIEYLYTNKPIINEFDKELLYQLSLREQFETKYFDEI